MPRGFPAEYPGVRAAKLRTYISLQHRVEHLDGAGAMLEPTWVEFGKCWARIDQQLGYRKSQTEGVFSDELRAVRSYRVTMRWRDDVSETDRIVMLESPTMPLNILSISDPDNRRRQLNMICEAGLTSG